MSSPASFSCVTSKYTTDGTGERRVCVGGTYQKRRISTQCWMAQRQIYLPTYRMLNVNNLYNDMFSSTAKQTFFIRRQDVDFVKHLSAKIVITVTGSSVVLAPVPQWFSQIDLKTNADNALIATMFSDSTMANLLTVVPAGKEKSLYASLNIDYSNFGYLGTTNALAPGSYTFYLPLFVNSVIGNFDGLRLADSNADLSFEFTPANPIVSGQGAITVTSFGFSVESARMPESDKAKFILDYKMFSTENQFLDPLVTKFSSVTLTAGASNYFNLLPVFGLCSHQLLIVRPAGSGNNNSGSAGFNWLNVGDETASIDLVDCNNTSLWGGGGSAVSCKLMRTHLACDQSDNNFIATKPAYYITYCSDIRSSLLGQVKGGYKFESSNVQLQLNLGAAPIQEVQTISFSSVPAVSGFYRFSFRGELSIALPATAPANVILVALQSMKTFASQYITVIPSGPITSSQSLTLTFAHPATAGLLGDLVTIVSDGLAASATTARTIAGTSGLNTGNYDVVVYSYVFKTGSYVGGVLRSDMLLA